jgi:putative Ca2+/H+ antiporter (TMEM165/GDT1 family)
MKFHHRISYLIILTYICTVTVVCKEEKLGLEFLTSNKNTDQLQQEVSYKSFDTNEVDFNKNLVNANTNLKEDEGKSKLFIEQSLSELEKQELQKNEVLINIDKGDKNFWPSFFTGFNLIFISEIGDKTFILTLFFTLKLGRMLTFLTTSTTLVLLNAFWLIVGASLPMLIYQTYVNWFAVGLFLIFGTILLIEGFKMDDKKIIDEFHELEIEKEIEEEVEEIDEGLKEKLLEEEKTTHKRMNKILEEEDKLYHKSDNNQVNQSEVKKDDADKKTNYTSDSAKKLDKKTLEIVDDKNKITVHSPKHHEKTTFQIIWGFSMSLILAECGDRSQITAVAIAAVYDFKGVLLGSSIAHIIAAFIAVTIGHYVSEHVSQKTITLIGGVLFYLYAIDFFFDSMSG